MTTNRTHRCFRAYISAARYEHYTPVEYTQEIIEQEALSLWEDPQMITDRWEEAKDVARAAYEVWGLTASQQFEKGIIEQPRFIHNLIICSDLRLIFGDLSDIPQFDKNGNFMRDKRDDMLVPEVVNGRIVGMKGYSSRQLLKEHPKRSRDSVPRRSPPTPSGISQAPREIKAGVNFRR